MSERPPIAFISYTHPDAEFCLALYEALLRHGIRPILDERDFLLGDDLPKRVFNEGIGTADAVLIVLSPDSAKSGWQDSEISAATVRSIEEGTRLISLVLRNLAHKDIPLQLRAKKYLRITDAVAIDDAADMIARTLFGDRPNPQIAPAPAWTTRAVAGMPGLEGVDELVLQHLCEETLRDRNALLGIGTLLEFAKCNDISTEQLEESIAVLNRAGFFEDVLYEGGTRLPIGFMIGHYGMQRYLNAHRAEQYAEAHEAVVAAIANERITELVPLVNALPQTPVMMIEHVLRDLERDGDLRLIGGCGDDLAWWIEPTLRRRLR